MQAIKPQKYQAKLAEKYYLTESKRFLLLKFELVKPVRVDFLAGQYVSLLVDDLGNRRSYSIVSTPDKSHGFDLLIEILPEGLGSKFAEELIIGESVEVLGPLGRFVVSESEGESLQKRLFVATGSGIAPIWSMINDLLLNKKVLSPIRLHWGMRSEADLFWMDNLERLAEAHPNFVYDVVLSRGSESWGLCRGHVQDCLSRDFNNGELGDWEGFVCGSQEIVIDICINLEELGMKKGLIHHEKFT